MYTCVYFHKKNSKVIFNKWYLQTARRRLQRERARKDRKRENSSTYSSCRPHVDDEREMLSCKYIYMYMYIYIYICV